MVMSNEVQMDLIILCAFSPVISKLRRMNVIHLKNFLARHEGYKSFFWRPPGINRKIRVVCRTWSATEHITYTDFSCQFDEVVI